jgi:hypothetical protein
LVFFLAALSVAFGARHCIAGSVKTAMINSSAAQAMTGSNKTGAGSGTTTATTSKPISTRPSITSPAKATTTSQEDAKRFTPPLAGFKTSDTLVAGEGFWR